MFNWMDTKELIMQAIRSGGVIAGGSPLVHPYQFSEENADLIASTLSSGLVTLTEERLREILVAAWLTGWQSGTDDYPNGGHAYASRIIETLGKEG